MRTVTTTGTLALALAATTLAACGSHGQTAAGSDYCRELKTDKAYFQTLDGNNPDLSRLDQAFRRMHSLAAAAPAGVAGDWKTLDTAVTTIEDALDDAGLKPDDLVALQKGDIPAGADLDKLEALGPKMQALSGSKVDDAAARIADNAKDNCGISLAES